jgi:hypothetical protein
MDGRLGSCGGIASRKGAPAPRMTERLEYDGLLGVCGGAAISSYATHWLRSFTDSDDREPQLGLGCPVRTASSAAQVSVSGKRVFECQRQKSKKSGPGDNCASQRPSAGTTTPPMRGYSRAARKSPKLADCLVGPGGFEPPTRPL